MACPFYESEHDCLQGGVLTVCSCPPHLLPGLRNVLGCFESAVPCHYFMFPVISSVALFRLAEMQQLLPRGVGTVRLR